MLGRCTMTVPAANKPENNLRDDLITTIIERLAEADLAVLQKVLKLVKSENRQNNSSSGSFG